MRKIMLFLLLALTTGLAAQNTDYLVTPKGIGQLKLGMKKAELEKVLGKKIQLKNLLEKDGYSDTIKAKYKNIDVQVYIEKSWVDEDNYELVLSGIRTSSPLCKTAGGIGIGTDKLRIVNAYENSTVYIWPEYEDDTYTRRSKTKAVISVFSDEEANSLNFYLVNKKVASIEVTYAMEGD